MEEISWGEKILSSPRYSTSTIGLPSWSMTLNGHDSISFLTVGSSNLRPINRLALVVSNHCSTGQIGVGKWLTWYQRWCFLGSWQPDSLLIHRSNAPCRWRRRRMGWWSYPARWQWFPHWFPHSWQLLKISNCASSCRYRHVGIASGKKRTARVGCAYQRKRSATAKDSTESSIQWGLRKHTKIDTDRTFVDLVSHVGCVFFRFL